MNTTNGARNESGNEWLSKRYFEEVSVQFRTVWDLYIKWYTVFLTFQIAALAGTLQYVHPQSRWPIVVAFIVQNFISGVTAVWIAYYSRSAGIRMTGLATQIAAADAESSALRKDLEENPLPSALAYWAGWANAIAHVTLIGCWVAAIWIPLPPKA